jgi:hypothetical protein
MPQFSSSQSLPIVRYDPKAGERSADMMHWGLATTAGHAAV